MRIVWDESGKQFEAMLTPGDKWQSDLEAVRAAGFKTEGPPEWKWTASKAGVLTKLRTLSVSTGLTITSAALQYYNQLKEQEEKNQAVRKALKEARKKAELEYDPKIDWDSIQPEPVFYIKYTPPPPPSLLCSVCQTPVYFYESSNPPLCLDCEFEEF